MQADTIRSQVQAGSDAQARSETRIAAALAALLGLFLLGNWVLACPGAAQCGA